MTSLCSTLTLGGIVTIFKATLFYSDQVALEIKMSDINSRINHFQEKKNVLCF